MAQSLSKLFVHIIFHIKNYNCQIRKLEKDELFAYMASIIKDNESIPILINGVEDHVHILCIMSKNISLARIVEEIKLHSSRWIKTKDRYYAQFAWQGGTEDFQLVHHYMIKQKTTLQNRKHIIKR